MTEEKKYVWDLDFQQQILAFLLTDKTFLIQSIQLIKPSYFIERAHEQICSILFDYFNSNNGLPPRSVLVNELKSKNDPTKAMLFVGELEFIISNYVHGVDCREHCLQKITEFARQMALKEAISKSLTLLDKNSQDKWEKIEGLFKNALVVDRSFDGGMDYFVSVEERYDRMRQKRENRETFSMGLEGIDSCLPYNGLSKKEIGAFMGASGSGKSVLLIRSAVRNVVLGKKVLYISLEMDELSVAKRADALLSRVGLADIHENEGVVKSALVDVVEDYQDKSRLIIKQFPAGQVGVGEIRAYVAQLVLRGWVPDLLILDYLGELRDYADMAIHESRQRLVRDLRGFAMEENLCILTALQANRTGKFQSEVGDVLDDSSVGDSYGSVRPLDLLVSLFFTANEKMCNLGRMFIAKNRNGPSKVIIYYKQNPYTLDITEISKEEWNTGVSQISQKSNVEMVLQQKFKR